MMLVTWNGLMPYEHLATNNWDTNAPGQCYRSNDLIQLRHLNATLIPFSILVKVSNDVLAI
jgi:hypothetical protein